MFYNASSMLSQIVAARIMTSRWCRFVGEISEKKARAYYYAQQMKTWHKPKYGCYFI